MAKLLMYLFYGLVAGFSQFIPVSASAHQGLFPLFFSFDSLDPLLRLFVHAGMLGALILLYRQKMSYLYTQNRLAAMPARSRPRPVDADGVAQSKLILTAGIPAVLGGLLSLWVSGLEIRFFWLAILLAVTGILIYLPDYVPGGTRKLRYLTPFGAVILGAAVGLSAIPGISAVGLALGVGLMRKWDRSSLMDTVLLLVGMMLCGTLLGDLIGWIISGFAGFSMLHMLGCLLAAGAAFGGGVGAISTMRYLTVKNGFGYFAFYSWGLALLSFLIYLVV